MALANVAFLSALNGLRVLVMDWDLEAPGLGYYFRGLLDTPEAKVLREAPGVLDFLWEWRRELNLQTDADLLLQRFREGSPFQACVQSLPIKPVNQTGVLDFIGAGSRYIASPEPIPYEAALANFSWADFFEQEAGGHVIDCLRNWAKSHYDLILIDSRTGLADVAGICTMQIPDTVALCFVLNRQNIDGISKVAAAIRAHGSVSLCIRAAPMRLARHDTSEESDAWARAIWELKRVGGFSGEAILGDFRKLSVEAADNVPFYETLAPFAATNPVFDKLTLNYLELASDLLGITLEIPSLDPEWIALVRRRLLPRHATVDYLTKLQAADPARTITELASLIESAFDAENDGGELDDDYVAALVRAVLDISLTDIADSPVDMEALLNRTIELLRMLVVDSPLKWRGLLISAIERYLELYPILFKLESEDDIALFEELDELLSLSPTIENRLKQVLYRRKLAKIFLSLKNTEATMQIVDEILLLLKDLSSESLSLAPEQRNEILAAEIDISLFTGDVARLKEEPEQSLKAYRKGLEQSAPFELGETRNDIDSLVFALHSRFVDASPELISVSEKAYHAVQAVKWNNSLLFPPMFIRLARAVLKMDDEAEYLLEFCECTLQKHFRTNYFVHVIYGQQSKFLIEFFRTLADIAKVLGEIDNERYKAALTLIADISTQALQSITRRRQIIDKKVRDELSAITGEIIHILNLSSLPDKKPLDLQKTLDFFESPVRVPVKNPINPE